MLINYDDGFNFGKGVFETVKVVGKKPILLDKHIKRINNSLLFLKINQKIEVQEIINFINSEKSEDYALKIVVSDENKIITKRKDPYIDVDSNKIFKLKLSDMIRNSTSHMVYHKTLNYYDNIIEKRKAKAEGFDEVIFLNERGELAEGAVSNIFLKKGDVYYTPPLTAGILNGTMREFVIENYNVVEKTIFPDEIKEFDEIFITNALMGIRTARF